MGNACYSSGSEDVKLSTEVTVEPNEESEAQASLGTSSGPESLDWVNLCFQSYWSKFNGWAGNYVETGLKPALYSKLPSVLKDEIKITSFTLGDAPPKFGRIISQSRSTNDARLSFEFDWLSNLTMQLCFQNKMLGKQSLLGMRGVTCKGSLSVVFNVQEQGDFLSGWGATMYFLDAPDIELHFTGLASTAELPGIRGILHSVIQEQISSRIVLPNSCTLTFGSEDANAGTKLSMGSVSPPIGALRITLLDLTGLRSGSMEFLKMFKNSHSKYVSFSLGGRTWKYHSIDADTVHTFVVNDLRQSLKISVSDEELLETEFKIAQAGPFSVKNAVALSGKSVPLEPTGSHGRHGAMRLNICWLQAKPKHLGNDGCIVCVKLSAIKLPLNLGSSAKLQAKLDVGSTTKETETRVVTRSESAFVQALEQLKAMGVHKNEMDKLEKAHESLVKKIGVITVLYLHAHAKEIDTATLSLTLLVPGKGGIFAPVGKPWSMPLQKVVRATDLTLKGPMPLGFHAEVDADIELWGLIPSDVGE